jgi:hypothetical protein
MAQYKRIWLRYQLKPYRIFYPFGRYDDIGILEVNNSKFQFDGKKEKIDWREIASSNIARQKHDWNEILIAEFIMTILLLMEMIEANAVGLSMRPVNWFLFAFYFFAMIVWTFSGFLSAGIKWIELKYYAEDQLKIIYIRSWPRVTIRIETEINKKVGS